MVRVTQRGFSVMVRIMAVCVVFAGEEDQDTYDIGRLKKPMAVGEDVVLTRPLLQQHHQMPDTARYVRPVPRG